MQKQFISLPLLLLVMCFAPANGASPSAPTTQPEPSASTKFEPSTAKPVYDFDPSTAQPVDAPPANQAAAVKPLGNSQKPSDTPTHLMWRLLGPFPVTQSGSADKPDVAAQKSAFSADLLAAQGGVAQVMAQLRTKVTISGVEREWKTVEAAGEIVSLNAGDGKADFQIAYAVTEFEVQSDTKALLGVGSDDGVRVWLNGVLIHEHWITRPVQLDDDAIPVVLKAGQNRLVVKIQNIRGAWGFACRLMDYEARTRRLVAAARTSDLKEIQILIDNGCDVNGRTSDGLMPFLAARIWGRKEAVDFLAKNGADTKAPLPAPEILVDKLLSERIGADDAGVAVLVARHGKILFQKGYGLAEIEHRVPVTVDTKFRVGSITKQFTAAAILQLQEAGKIKVTDPLSKYYPDFPRASEVTLRHLLTHTSGIQNYTETPSFLQDFTKPISTENLIVLISKNPYDFKPGLRWSYSNSGYVILGGVIEKVSGLQYGDFLRTTLFAPLGMANSGEYRNATPPTGAAVGYAYEGRSFKKAPDWDMSRVGGAGAIYSSVRDLYLWNEAVFGGKVLSKETLAEAFTPVVPEENKNDTLDGGYGYGWNIERFRGAREISHGGSVAGFLSSILRLPEQELTVVVLGNARPTKPETDADLLSHEIAELYVGGELPPVPKKVPLEPKPVASAALAATVGRYDFHFAILLITQEKDRVYAQVGWYSKHEIFPKSETEFLYKDIDAQITFVKEDSGNVVEAVFHQGGQTTHARRLEAISEITLDDAQSSLLLGVYDFKPTGKMTISREDNRLYSQLTDNPRFSLGAISTTEFFLREINAQLTFVKDTEGKVTKVVLHQGGQDYEMPKLMLP